MIVCRCEQDIPADERRKIGLFCNVPEDNVISAPDVGTIYEVPICYHERGLDRQLARHFRLGNECDVDDVDLSRWNEIVNRVKNPEGEVAIAVVGKYTNLLDSYKSLAEALDHGGIANNVSVKLNWIDLRSIRIRRRSAPSVRCAGNFGARWFWRTRCRGKNRGRKICT